MSILTAVTRLSPLVPRIFKRFVSYQLIVTDKSSAMANWKGLSPRDPSSYARPELVAVTYLAINLNVDFARKVLHGHVDLTVEKIDSSSNEIILDSKDLNISKITEKASDQELNYVLSEKNGEFGSKLTVTLPQEQKNSYVLSISYETSPDATGLQWLTPEQTAGKKHPYMFSQFQAIHARSVLPCQDTPAVKTKYKATISAPKDLTVLMSALAESNEQHGTLKDFSFNQPIPMPAYLIAIAVGALESRPVGPRSKVWAEKEIIEAAAWEFSETEHQLKTAEDICGPYVWGVYDLLVLPPSFAYGGMENPCLTFITPSLIAGDKSLVNVVAHEIAHSWTGNLVTNRNFEHFWLNEGFTVFVERKIKGRLTSPQSQDFDAYSRVSELQEVINNFGKDNPLTKLVVDLSTDHPDDAFSIVPYEKGQTFLRYLEKTVGGPSKFEPFLRSYFDTFKYKSIDTNDFKAYFETYFASVPEIKGIDWDLWLYSPGMPPAIPDYDITLARNCDNFVSNVRTGNLTITQDDAKKFTPDQIIYLLQKLLNGDALPIGTLQQLDALFHFSSVNNSEIKFRWLRLGLKAHWEDSIEPTIQWVNVMGRMKFARPLYKDLYAWEKTRQKAIDNFQAHKRYMMHVTAYTVSKDLHLRE